MRGWHSLSQLITRHSSLKLTNGTPPLNGLGFYANGSIRSISIEMWAVGHGIGAFAQARPHFDRVLGSVEKDSRPSVA